MDKSNYIAKGGLFTSLTVIILYISSIIPTSKLTLLAITTSIISISILSIDIRASFIVYISCFILSFILGLKGLSISYLLFFGLYAFMKYYIEGLRKPFLEILLKLIFFNISMLILFYIYKQLSFPIPSMNIPYYILLVILQVIFIIFDYALTLIISQITIYIKKIL